MCNQKDSDQPVHKHSLISVCWSHVPSTASRLSKWEHLQYWMDIQADLSLCWLYKSYCRFCCVLAHFSAKNFRTFYLMVRINRVWIFSILKTCRSLYKPQYGKPAFSCVSTEMIQTNVHSLKTYVPVHDKTNKMACMPSEISLGIHQSDQSSLSAWRKLGSLATHWVHSKDSDQTGQMPSLIWVFAGNFVGFVMCCFICYGYSFEVPHQRCFWWVPTTYVLWKNKNMSVLFGLKKSTCTVCKDRVYLGSAGQGLSYIIKISLFKYTENFATKKMQIFR